MIDTAGTICGAASCSRSAARAGHRLRDPPAVLRPGAERLENSVIEKVVVTNTLPIPPERRSDKLVVLSIAPILASALRAVFEDQSVSEIFQRRERLTSPSRGPSGAGRSSGCRGSVPVRLSPRPAFTAGRARVPPPYRSTTVRPPAGTPPADAHRPS
jgi:hypothetical protein